MVKEPSQIAKTCNVNQQPSQARVDTTLEIKAAVKRRVQSRLSQKPELSRVSSRGFLHLGHQRDAFLIAFLCGLESYCE